MSWYKNIVTSDKVLLVTGEYPFESLLGEKEIDALNGSADKQKGLFGDTITSFISGADKTISLTGSVGVSLLGRKILDNYLLASKETTITLLGDAPYSYFHIHVDTTYVTSDYKDIRCDRD